MQESTSAYPEITQEDYRDFYESPCEKVAGNQSIWYGTGIDPKEHPLVDKIQFDVCGECDSDDILVIAAEWKKHPFTGEESWEYEIVCNECMYYTQRSVSEENE